MTYRWQGETTVVVLDARERHGLPPLGADEWPPPAAPVTSGVSKKKKKKKSTETKYHTLLLSTPWNTPALQLPLPNVLGDALTFGHCSFPRPYN